MGPCFPLPNPTHQSRTIPNHNKSEAENFIERLWAYLTIENLLDEKETDMEVERVNSQRHHESNDVVVNETNLRKEKALKLALRARAFVVGAYVMVPLECI